MNLLLISKRVGENIRGQGFQGSSEVLKHYKELKEGPQSYQLCLEIYKITKRLKSDIEEVERMLKALIKSLENKHLTP